MKVSARGSMAVLMPGEVCSWERGRQRKRSGIGARRGLLVPLTQTDTAERKPGRADGRDGKFFVATSRKQTRHCGSSPSKCDGGRLNWAL